MSLENHGYTVKEKVHNTKKLEALSEIRKQHLLMFYFSLVKIYTMYITCTESHSMSQRELAKGTSRGQSFSHVFSVRPTWHGK